MEDGTKVGAWVSTQRTAHSKGILSEERTQQLVDVGFVWGTRVTVEWDENVDRLVQYKDEHGECLVPQKFEMEDGTKVGAWVSTQRTAYSRGTLSEERTQRLVDLGFVWGTPVTVEWGDYFDRLVQYKEEHGDCLVPQKFKMEDGTKLGIWVNTQRTAHSRGILSEERMRQLVDLGLVWGTPLTVDWDNNFDRLA